MRVDVSPWANPSAFAVFANERVLDKRDSNVNLLDDVGGDTSV